MMRLATFLMIFVAPVLAAGSALAQDSADSTYDLQRAITTALANHSSLRVAQGDVEAAQAQVAQAAAHFRPQVNAQAGYTWLQESPSFDVANMGTFQFGEQDNWTANVGVEYPLYTGGKQRAMIEGAEAVVTMAEDDLQRQRQTVANNAAMAFFRALEARRMIAVLDDQITALEKAVRAAEAMYRQQVVAKIDVLRPEVALGGAHDALRQMQTAYATALAGLVEAMGLPPGTSVELQETESPQPEVGTVEERWERAWELRPELRRLRAQEAAARAQLGIARGESRPQVGLFGRAEAARPTFYPDTGILSAGVMITQSLSDGGAARAQEREARARLEQLQAADEQLRYGIAAQVVDGVGQLGSAQSRVESTRGTVELAEETLRLAQVGYSNGVTPMLDLLQAQAALTQARADYENAQSDVRQAYARLSYVTGDNTDE